MIPVMDPEPVLRVHWWITPVLELALSALLVLVFALRIRTMR